ncbi:MAG TPA: alpha/beta hydrolase [Chloroflexota bacterium]|nr:alpha/beta hydrolase [Chloroflexota bacterium]
MQRRQSEQYEMFVGDAEFGNTRDGYQEVRLATSRGDIDCRYYRAPNAQKGAIWVGGVGGGFDTPAQGIYPRLCEDLVSEGTSSLRVRFRHPTILTEAVLDVLAGLNYLENEGVRAAALIGHSFGGAVVIQAAAQAPLVRTIVTLATQSYGTTPVSNLGPGCSVLAIHGLADRVLPYSCSEAVARNAHEPKKLILYEGADHSLDEVAEEVYRAVRDWIVERLSEATR